MSLVTIVTLFSHTDRTDPIASRYGEDNFSFLDRVDQKFWKSIASNWSVGSLAIRKCK